MKRTTSRIQWAVFAGSAFACGAALLAIRTFPPERIDADVVIDALQAERTALRDYDDSKRDRLRAQAHSIPRSTPSDIDSLRQKLGPAWRWQSNESGAQTATLNRSVASARDWPAILAEVKALQRHPGVSIKRVELLGTPSRNAGGFTRVQLEIAWRP